MNNFYKINEEKVVIRQIEEHLIILDVDTGEFISAEDTARFIIEKVIAGKSDNEIIQEMMNKYNCPSYEVLRSDFQDFITELKNKGILVV